MGLSLSGDDSRRNGTSQSVSLNATTSDSNYGLSIPNDLPQQSKTAIVASQYNKSNGQLIGDQALPDMVVNDKQMNTTSSANNTTNITNHTIQTQSGSDDEFSLNLFGYILYPFRWITLTTLTSWLGPMSSLAMIIGCVMPYVPQYATIYKTRSCAGFSTFVCLTLLLANILRIAFWFGHPFELPLLIQSIIMILAQILLLELCIRVKRQNLNGVQVKRTLFSSNLRWFWRWADLASYLEFLFIITILLSLAVYFLIDCEPFIETLGYCALVTESMLGLPQVIKNYKNHSVQGMSLSMVLMWLAGDTFKTGYFISNAVPYQFWLCGLMQITIDLIIICQVCLYRQKAPSKGVAIHLTE